MGCDTSTAVGSVHVKKMQREYPDPKTFSHNLARGDNERDLGVKMVYYWNYCPIGFSCGQQIVERTTYGRLYRYL